MINIIAIFDGNVPNYAKFIVWAGISRKEDGALKRVHNSSFWCLISS